MKKGEILIVNLSCEPLFRKGDKFRVLKFNNHPDMLPIEAMRLKDKEVYGFYPSDFEGGEE